MAEPCMDFIERIFHLAPNNGSGSLELILLELLLVLPLAVAQLRRMCAAALSQQLGAHANEEIDNTIILA